MWELCCWCGGDRGSGSKQLAKCWKQKQCVVVEYGERKGAVEEDREQDQ